MFFQVAGILSLYAVLLTFLMIGKGPARLKNNFWEGQSVL